MTTWTFSWSGTGDLATFDPAWPKNSASVAGAALTSSNRLRAAFQGVSFPAVNYWSTAKFLDSSTTATIQVVTVAARAGVAARLSASALTGYRAWWLSDTNSVQLARMTAGSAATLGTIIAVGWTAGTTHTLRLDVTKSGSNAVLAVYADGVQIITATDTSPIATDGYAGVWFASSQAVSDSVGAQILSLTLDGTPTLLVASGTASTSGAASSSVPALAVVPGTGNASGEGASSFPALALVPGTGSAAGQAASSFPALALVPGTGSAAGQAASSFPALALVPGTGNAAGQAEAVGRSPTYSAAAASAEGTASSNVPALAVVPGSAQAAGAATVTGIYASPWTPIATARFELAQYAARFELAQYSARITRVAA